MAANDKKEFGTKELLRIAYKKLKSTVFYDKTQLPLRDKIVMFERGEFEEIFDKVAQEIDSGLYLENSGFGEITNGVLDGISCLILPKALEKENNFDKGFYSNANKNSVIIDKPQYFIDMDVIGHVLGVAWILAVGYALDEEGYENSYGNRLKKHLIAGEKPTYSPYLFEPYFSQYESWRDKGLEQAKKLLQNDKNVIIMTLDFSRFYYSVDIDENKLTEIILSVFENRNIENKVCALSLTKFIYRVIKKYSEKVRSFNKELVGERNILPIGFAPSNILGNYCLKDFDNAVIKGWNPTYYGRYVDDVLIIDKVEKNSPIYKAAQNHTIDTEFAIDYYLLNCDAWNKQDSKCTKNNKCGLFFEKPHKKNEQPVYQINKGFLEFKGSEICLQNQKAKLFYFDSSQSDMLISCFQKNLQHNVSEFRYMPEDEPVFNCNDYTEIYNILEKSGPNKLNGVNEFGLDKFCLSKFLGKYMRISGLIDDLNESQFKSDIKKIFTKEVTVENYSAWEKIFAIFVINEYFTELTEFVDIILKSVKGISVKTQGEINTSKLIKQSLIYTLYSGLGRTLSLVWGKKMSDIIGTLERKLYGFCHEEDINIERSGNIEEYRVQYCLTRMCDKYAMPFAIDELIEGNTLYLDDGGDLANLSSFKSFVKALRGKKEGRYFIENYADYRYYPYVFTVMDLTFTNLLDSVIDGNIEKLNRNDDLLRKEYCRLNYDASGSEKKDNFAYFRNLEKSDKDIITDSYCKVGSGEFKKVKIAVANTELNDKLLENLLKNKTDRTYKRYDNLVKMVNAAVEYKADMLVLPEGYLPIDWLPIFARTCAKNQMAAVVGVEHFVVKGCVYNITATILPYREDEYNYAYIHFHEKTHFAPQEEETIKSHGKSIAKGREYTLFCWNDFWFPVYCCYELTSIKDRALFQNFADAIIAVEWNMDVNYYSNIVESLARDVHCYCIQVNMSKYGDSRITQPASTERKDLLRVKGGKNSIILIDEIDVEKLREFQLKGNPLQRKTKEFKPTPPDFKCEIVQWKRDGELWDKLPELV
ncbi:MAG: hypothetical protein K2O67_00130 [Clostridia bacterium]|nr:hypothetical protein [Clostridia bacterium]